jgi:hypothetical protein
MPSTFHIVGRIHSFSTRVEMRNLAPHLFSFVLFSVLSLSCGDNIAVMPSNGSTFLPPTNLKALSVDSSTVRLNWTSPGGVTDSLLSGYVIHWTGNEVSVDKSTVSVTIVALPPGETVFTIFSRKLTGDLSDAVTIRWAPAMRFDSTYALYESDLVNSARAEGFNVGTQTMNPSTMSMDFNDLNVQRTMDLFFFGGRGLNQAPLSMWSSDRFAADWNATRFSTITYSSASLDYPLSSFPNPSTFTMDSIAVSDNTIYFVRAVGDNGSVNYVRLHLRVRAGTLFPDRIIEVRVSLQRVPNLLYASTTTRSVHRLRC